MREHFPGSLLAKNGQTYELKVIELESEALHGSDGRNTYKIPYQQIIELEVRKFSLLKTSGATVGTGAVLYGVLVLTAGIVFGHALEDGFKN